MKCSLVVLLAVLCAALLSDTEALRLRIRGRRVLRRLRGPLCRGVCSRVCTVATSGSAAPVCVPVCHQLCRRVKRAPEEETVVPLTKPFPSKFEQYDKDSSGGISLEEFADVLGLEPSHPGVKEAFNYADSDGNGVISKVEFHEAPWVFEDEDAEDE